MGCNVLVDAGIKHMYHVAPLQYLVFYLRSLQLQSKSILLKDYQDTHFRSSSKNVDIKRGFCDVVHCTNNEFPPILISKLNKGYQHMEICIDTGVLQEKDYILCKYNIAKNRGLFSESILSGRCYDDFKIPVAVNIEEKRALLSSIPINTHIEILVRQRINLPDTTIFRFFSDEDADLADRYFNKMDVTFGIKVINHSFDYYVHPHRKATVENYLETAYANIDWKGNGLEFDR